MKIMKSTFLLGLIALASSGLMAQTQSEAGPYSMGRLVIGSDREKAAYLDSYAKTPGTLYPTAVTVPYLNGIYAGNSLDLKFTVDPSGHAHNFRFLGGTPDVGLVTLVSNAIRNWQFSPAESGGTAVSQDASIHIDVVGRITTSTGSIDYDSRS